MTDTAVDGSPATRDDRARRLFDLLERRRGERDERNDRGRGTTATGDGTAAGGTSTDAITATVGGRANRPS